jgi:hypothetical protein
VVFPVSISTPKTFIHCDGSATPQIVPCAARQNTGSAQIQAGFSWLARQARMRLMVSAS